MIAANTLCYGSWITHLIFHLRMAEGPCGELISQVFVAVMRWFHLPTEEQNSLWAGVWPGKNPLLVYTAEHLEHPTTPPRKQNLSEDMSQCSCLVVNIITLLNTWEDRQVSPSPTFSLKKPHLITLQEIQEFLALTRLMGYLTPILLQHITKLGMKTKGRKQLLNLFHQLVPYQDPNQLVLTQESRG